MPMPALAAATSRSALATSGRRCSSADGSATWIGGRLGGQRRRRQRKAGGRQPQQHRNGMFEPRALQAGRRQLRPRVLPQCVGLVQIGGRGDAGVVATLGLLPGGVELRDRILQQLHGRIITAQGEVIRGEFRLQLTD